MPTRHGETGRHGGFVCWCLLTVVQQDLVARFRQFRAVLLQTGQDGEIALIHHLAAETSDVPRAGALFRFSPAVRLLLLRGLRHSYN